MDKISQGTIISTRIRLARNITGYVFPGRLSEKNAKEIIRLVSSALNSFADFKLYYMDSISESDANSLMGSHLISPVLIEKKRTSAALISEAENLSVMINEEDHLREQCIVKGFQLKNAYNKLSDIDNKLGKKIPFAYEEQLGYLTACPTNLGTGLRASVMLYLPALTINDRMRTIVKQLIKQGLTVRGLYGEGSEAKGYIYQVSNEVTLGVTEEEVLDQVDKSARILTEYEVTERRNLLKGDKAIVIKDKCMRAYGVATNCALLSSDELEKLAADIKLGVCLGYINMDNVCRIDDLVNDVQPYNINDLAGCSFVSQTDRESFRADYVSDQLKKITAQN